MIAFDLIFDFNYLTEQIWEDNMYVFTKNKDNRYFTIPEDEIKYLTSVLTVAGGRVVYVCFR